MLYVAIGHVCQDVAPEGKVLGGTVTFATLTARALGWSAAAVTRAHTDLDLAALRDIDCIRLSDAVTTTFHNIETAAGRIQYVRAAAGAIAAHDIPARLHDADVVHLAPIACEVEAGTIEIFDRRSFVGVTPQGWMRQWDRSGRVSRCAWLNADELLRRADAVVLSIDDAGGDWTQIERWAGNAKVLVATQGREGCTLYDRGQSVHVPAEQVAEVDPVGAGDIFAAAFFIQLRESGDALRAARRANCLAARSVTRRGLASIPDASDVRACAGA